MYFLFFLFSFFNSLEAYISMSGLEKWEGRGLKIEGMMDGRGSKTKINENSFWVISTEKKWTMYLTCINCTITVSLY